MCEDTLVLRKAYNSILVNRSLEGFFLGKKGEASPMFFVNNGVFL